MVGLKMPVRLMLAAAITASCVSPEASPVT